MTEATLNAEDDSEDRKRRPPRAVVGSLSPRMRTSLFFALIFRFSFSLIRF